MPKAEKPLKNKFLKFKKLFSPKKAATKKPHIVEEKLHRVMEQAPSSETPSAAATSPKRTGGYWWVIVSAVLILVFVSLLLYENNQYFKNNFNRLLNTTGLFKLETGEKKEEVKAEPFLMKMTIIYNQENKQMKTNIESYLKNIEANLKNTKTSATWIDKNDERAKSYISKLDAKFLPIFIVDENIKQHPQYSLFADAVLSKGGLYQFQSEGMEYMVQPAVGEARHLGADPAKAKILIMEYASFSCGYCKAMYPILQEVLATYGNKISLVIKHFNRGGVDLLLAQSVECAADQGKLDTMMATLYQMEADFYAAMQKEDFETAVYDQLKLAAKQAGANADKVLSCVKSGKYADRVNKDTAEGIEFGIAGTPSLFINKIFIGGAMEKAPFIQLIETELTK